MPTELEPLKVVELFAGIGSQRMALRLLGIPHEVVAISEINPKAIESYEAIHGPTLNLGDVRDIEHLPACDLLTYSFPCTDISIAGRQEGMTEGSGTRSSLLWEVGRLLADMVDRDIPPFALLMENVDAVTNNTFMPVLNRWISRLADLGYTSSYKVLNACDFVIPQHRRRCFMVSARNQMSFEFPIGEPTDLCLGDMMDCDVPESYFLSDEKVAGFTPLPAKADSRGIVIDGDLNDPKNLEIWNRVYSPLGLSPTLTALSGGGTVPRVHVIGIGGGGVYLLVAWTSPEGFPAVANRTGMFTAFAVFVLLSGSAGIRLSSWTPGGVSMSIEIDGQGIRIRYLTERECWRLMGQPDWAFDRASGAGVSRTQLYRQAGNAIVVTVLMAIFYGMYIAQTWCRRPTLDSFFGGVADV